MAEFPGQLTLQTTETWETDPEFPGQLTLQTTETWEQDPEFPGQLTLQTTENWALSPKEFPFYDLTISLGVDSITVPDNVSFSGSLAHPDQAVDDVSLTIQAVRQSDGEVLNETTITTDAQGDYQGTMSFVKSGDIDFIAKNDSLTPATTHLEGWE